VTEVIRLVARAAEELAVEHLLVGVIARDLVLQGVFGLGEGRQTLDVDFGVAVADWRQFDDLKSALLA
jgi:predicted nucleotidyltransferase